MPRVYNSNTNVYESDNASLLFLLSTESFYPLALTPAERISSFFYLSTWPSYLTDLLNLRHVGAVGARNYDRSSF